MSKASQKLKKDVLKHTIAFIHQERTNYSFEVLEKFFGGLIEMAYHAAAIRQESIQQLLDIGFYLIENGRWNAVGHSLSTVTDDETPTESVMALTTGLLYAIYLRRIGQLKEAQRLLKAIMPQIDLLPGNYPVMARFHQANVVRISGNYAAAEALYQDVMQRIAKKKDKTQRFVRIYWQWADLQFLKGHFQTALTILTELTDTQERSSLTHAESIRIMGHIYRFNLFTDKALNIYQQALAIAKSLKADGLISKLYTNLTETLCWIDPPKAIDMGAQAVQMNQDLDSWIEVGKAKAALGIAHALNQDVSTARQMAEAAKALQQQTGYRSGVLFAELALYLIAIASRDDAQLEAQKAVVKALITEVGVYPFLQLPIALHEADTAQIAVFEQQYEWLDFSQTQQMFQKYLESLTAHSH